MRIISVVLSVWVLFTFTACHQQKAIPQHLDKETETSSNKESTRYFDKNWNETDKASAHFYRIAQYDSTGKPMGLVRDYFMSGQLQFEGKIISETPLILDGSCTWYYENGNVQSKVQYLNGEVHGSIESFYENGQHRSSKYVINDQSQGMEMFFYPDGVLKEQCEYENGIMKDTCKKYHPNGNLKELQVRHASDKDVLISFKVWQENGMLFQTYDSKNGFFIGTYYTYYPNGKVHYYKEYDQNGNLNVEKIYDVEGNIEKSWQLESDTIH